MSAGGERSWTADYIYRGGKFESGVAMFAGSDGRITRFSKTRQDLTNARRLANRAILPGLVNCHSHSFQRAIRGRTEHRTSAGRDTFWTWRQAMYHAANLLSPEDIYHVARMAFLEMLVSGITTAGEFHYLHNAPDGTRYADANFLALEVLRAAADTGLRIALLRTAYARAGWNKPPDPLQARFITSDPQTFISDTEALRAELGKISRPAFAWIGVAPHSVRAVPLDYLLEIVSYARANGLQLHMHASEQPGEIEQCMQEYGQRPVELLHNRGVLDNSFTGIHAIHITEEEAKYLGSAKAYVCACPTTERNLGDGAVPADKLSQAGVEICFGSDSNIQIDLLEDARQLEYHLRMERLERAVLAQAGAEEALATKLFESATEVGARSLGAPGGCLEIGRPADFFTVDLDNPSIAGAGEESLLTNIVFCADRTAVRDVFIAGEQIVENGAHKLQDAVVREFAALQRRLWT